MLSVLLDVSEGLFYEPRVNFRGAVSDGIRVSAAGNRIFGICQHFTGALGREFSRYSLVAAGKIKRFARPPRRTASGGRATLLTW
jgi:hypothetical protein